jgi:septal ring factor EnvC (AmiA/AmiB activator)
MNQKNADNQPERQTPEILNESQPPTSPELVAASTKAEKTQPNRLQRFFRRALIWLVVLAIFFLAGIATDHYLRYKPLQDELNTTTAHLTLVQVQVDVSNARLALSLNDVAGAKAALSNTQQRLEKLVPRIANFDASLAQSMPQRLNLIVSGLARDPETAKIDLELFSKDLLKIEAALFND